MEDPTVLDETEEVENDATETETEGKKAEPKEAAADTDTDDVEVAETDEEVDGEDTDEDTEDEPEEIEFNFGGRKAVFRKDSLPEDLAQQVQDFASGTWSDYTRNKHELAEKAKSVEARNTALQQIESMTQEGLELFSRGRAITNEINRYQLDEAQMAALWKDNPDHARRLSDHVNKLTGDFQNVVAQLQTHEAETAKARDAERVRLAEEGEAIVKRRFKEFDEKALIDYAQKEFGVSRERSSRWAEDPDTTTVTYKAMLYDKLMAKAKQAKPRKKQPVPVETISKTVKPKPAKRSGLHDELSTEEWRRRREKQIAARQN